MKKTKDEIQINSKTCPTGGCSTGQIWLGIVVIIIIMIGAVIFGN